MLDRLKNWYAARPDSERRLLALMVIVFGALIVFIIVMQIRGAFTERAEEIAQKQAALDRIHEVRAEYLAARARRDEIISRLEQSRVDVSGYLLQQASEFGLSADATRRSSRAASASLNVPADEVEYEVRLSRAEHDDLMLYLDALEHSEHLLYVKSISLRKANNRNEVDGTPLEVTLIVSAFQKSDGTSSDEL